MSTEVALQFRAMLWMINQQALIASPRWFLCLSLVLFWMAWRLWRFTISPRLNPQEPKTLPYLFPWIGSVIPFSRDPRGTIYAGISEKRNPDRDPFILSLMGQQLYVVTNPQHLPEIYRNTTTLAFDQVVADIMVYCGTSKEAVDASNSEPPPYIPEIPPSDFNPSNKSLIKLAIDCHHIQLLPGPKSKVEPLADTFMKYISDFLEPDQVLSNDKIPGNKIAGRFDISLKQLAASVLVEAGTKTYWGKGIWELNPDMLQVFFDFDATIWKLFYKIPDMFAKDALQARDAMIQAMVTYLEQPASQRRDVCWFTKTMEQEFHAVGVSNRDIAAATISIVFAVNGNTYKLAFWAFCHMLADQSLFQTVQSEVRAGGANPTIDHLMDSCPMLNAILQELLRLYTNSISTRLITSDTTIAGKRFAKDGRIMIPYRQMHENAAVWGSDSLEFNPSRWLKNKELLRSKSFRPFGGGMTLCAGRLIAQRVVIWFVGLVISRYDVEGLGFVGNKFPIVESSRPNIGLMVPVLGDDCKIRLTPRK